MLMTEEPGSGTVQEAGITEVSMLPMVTSLSSCRRCWRISCDKEKLLPSAGSGNEEGMQGVKASILPHSSTPRGLAGGLL